MFRVLMQVHTLQAAGGINSPGPRRSARFANQQKPNSSSGQQQSATPGGRQPGTGTTQLQRSWLQTFVWIAWAALAVLIAVMAATNPSRAAFVDSISQLTNRGLGQWAGALLLFPVTLNLIGRLADRIWSTCSMRHHGSGQWYSAWHTHSAATPACRAAHQAQEMFACGNTDSACID